MNREVVVSSILPLYALKIHDKRMVGLKASCVVRENQIGDNITASACTTIYSKPMFNSTWAKR